MRGARTLAWMVAFASTITISFEAIGQTGEGATEQTTDPTVLPASSVVEYAPTNEELLHRIEILERQVQDAQSTPVVIDNTQNSGINLRFFDDPWGQNSFPSAELHGRFMWDWGWFEQDANSFATLGDIQNGNGSRRARLAAEGWLAENVNYEVEFEFAEYDDITKFRDVWVAVHDLPALGIVRIGHFKEPFSHEEMMSSRYTTFLERGLPNEFVPGRNVGIGSHSYCDFATFGFGVFDSKSANKGDEAGDEGEKAFSARLTCLLIDNRTNGHLFHVGSSYSYRRVDEGELDFGSRPEFELDAGNKDEGKVPKFVDTDDFDAYDYQLLGLEAAYRNGPLSIQGEYIGTQVARIGDPGLYFHGAYVYVSYILTGEQRTYDYKFGELARVFPRANFVRYGNQGSFGRGAWEIAARCSYIHLNDEDIEGGRLNDYTLGLNWYLNPYAKVMFNFIRADLADPSDGDSTTDIFAIRTAIDF